LIAKTSVVFKATSKWVFIPFLASSPDKYLYRIRLYPCGDKMKQRTTYKVTTTVCLPAEVLKFAKERKLNLSRTLEIAIREKMKAIEQIDRRYYLTPEEFLSFLIFKKGYGREQIKKSMIENFPELEPNIDAFLSKYDVPERGFNDVLKSVGEGKHE
jgi:hypothetical protein